MARIGLDASRFCKGDPRDTNHFHAIIGTNGSVEAHIGSLALYSNGFASVLEDATGKVTAFASHDAAIAYALAM